MLEALVDDQGTGGTVDGEHEEDDAGRGEQVCTEVAADDLALLEQGGRTRQETLNRLLFPGPTQEFEANRDEFGDTSVLHTRDWLYGMVTGQEHVISLGKGVRLLATLQAIGEMTGVARTEGDRIAAL